MIVPGDNNPWRRMKTDTPEEEAYYTVRLTDGRTWTVRWSGKRWETIVRNQAGDLVREEVPDVEYWRWPGWTSGNVR